MTKPRSVLDRLRARGEEVFAQISNELMSNEHFMKAVAAAWQGKEKLDQAAARALKQMNIPTRTEFKRAVSRIDALELEVGALKARARPRTAAPRKRRSGPGRGAPLAEPPAE